MKTVENEKSVVQSRALLPGIVAMICIVCLVTAYMQIDLSRVFSRPNNQLCFGPTTGTELAQFIAAQPNLNSDRSQRLLEVANKAGDRPIVPVLVEMFLTQNKVHNTDSAR